VSVLGTVLIFRSERDSFRSFLRFVFSSSEPSNLSSGKRHLRSFPSGTPFSFPLGTVSPNSIYSSDRNLWVFGRIVSSPLPLLWSFGGISLSSDPYPSGCFSSSVFLHPVFRILDSTILFVTHINILTSDCTFPLICRRARSLSDFLAFALQNVLLPLALFLLSSNSPLRCPS